MQGKPDMYRIKSRLPVDAPSAFAWHNRDGAIERLMPPWEDAKVISKKGGIREGDKISLKISWGMFDFRWDLKHQDYQEGKQFCDIQENGPFKHWIHRHIFRAIEGSEFSTLKDAIDYRLPLGMIGRILGRKFMTNKLNNLFDYRHQITKRDLKLSKKYPFENPLNILIAGSGMIGEALIPFLTTQGHKVSVLSRKKRTPETILWNPDQGILNPKEIEGFDVIINLCGESINQRWGRSARNKIKYSRIKSTDLLAQTIAQLKKKPSLLINASGSGYYGNQKEIVHEYSKIGSGFLSEVCSEWEKATLPAEKEQIRVVHLRMGAVLSTKGGALKKLLSIYRKGLGGKLGRGDQIFSWVSIEDLLGIIYHCIHDENIQGALNAVSPNKTTNSDLNIALSEHLKKMGWFHTPGFIIKILYGKMGKELLLEGSNVKPKKLIDANFEFEHPKLEKFFSLVIR